MKTNKSEVARLLAQIQLEYKSAELGLTGLSQGSSQHEVITAKTERIANLHTQLREVAGDQAMELIVTMLDKETTPASPPPLS